MGIVSGTPEVCATSEAIVQVVPVTGTAPFSSELSDAVKFTLSTASAVISGIMFVAAMPPCSRSLNEHSMDSI